MGDKTVKSPMQRLWSAGAFVKNETEIRGIPYYFTDEGGESERPDGYIYFIKSGGKKQVFRSSNTKIPVSELHGVPLDYSDIIDQVTLKCKSINDLTSEDFENLGYLEVIDNNGDKELLLCDFRNKIFQNSIWLKN